MQDLLDKIDQFFQEVFLKKLPQLPDNIQKNIVKIFPWIILVLLFLSAPGMVVGLLASPLAVLSRHGPLFLISMLLGLVQLGLSIFALPHLFKRKMKGWRLIYWTLLLSIVSAVLYFSLFGLLFTALGLYFVYQIKKFYR